MALRSVPDAAPENYGADEYAAAAVIAETLRDRRHEAGVPAADRRRGCLMANPLESSEIRAAIHRATYERLGVEALRDGLRQRGHTQDEIEGINADVEKAIEEEKV